MCFFSVLIVILCFVLGFILLSFRIVVVIIMVVVRGGGLRGFCCLGCCYVESVIGSFEVGLWFGVGFMFGS